MLNEVVLFAQFGVSLLRKIGQVGVAPGLKVWHVSHWFLSLMAHPSLNVQKLHGNEEV
jgi:hypothetical protein